MWRPAKTSCRAEVVFYGLDIDDIMTADPVAAVTLDAGDDARQLARFAGMCVVAMLRGARNARDHVEPFAEMGSILCTDLLNRVAVPDPAKYSLAEAWRPADRLAELEVGTLFAEADGRRDVSVDVLLRIAFPRVGGEPVAGKTRRFRASLDEGRRGGSWVNLRSRNAMLSAMGVLCLFEQIARDHPVETTERVAAVSKRLFEFHEQHCGEDVPLTYRQATAMYDLAGELAAAADPLTAAIPLD